MVYMHTDASQSSKQRKVRVPDLAKRKGGQPLVCVTCYDATMARLVEMAQVDLVLVGDSLGHVVQGGTTTTRVSAADVAYHTRCVAAVLRTPLLVADMPFGLAGFDSHACLDAAVSFVRAGAEAVKLEGATDEICMEISRLVRHGIPVLGHIGLTPQSIHTLGGYRVQAKEAETRRLLVEQAIRLEEAGCFGVVLELVATDAAEAVTEKLGVPTIGIGAGSGCDGQILVLNDLLGMNLDFKPSFLKHFAQLENTIVEALNAYAREVSERTFPAGGT